MIDVLIIIFGCRPMVLDKNWINLSQEFIRKVSILGNNQNPEIGKCYMNSTLTNPKRYLVR